jgi:hypothetical protein
MSDEPEQPVDEAAPPAVELEPDPPPPEARGPPDPAEPSMRPARQAPARCMIAPPPEVEL